MTREHSTVVVLPTVVLPEAVRRLLPDPGLGPCIRGRNAWVTPCD